MLLFRDALIHLQLQLFEKLLGEGRHLIYGSLPFVIEAIVLLSLLNDDQEHLVFLFG